MCQMLRLQSVINGLFARLTCYFNRHRLITKIWGYNCNSTLTWFTELDADVLPGAIGSHFREKSTMKLTLNVDRYIRDRAVTMITIDNFQFN